MLIINDPFREARVPYDNNRTRRARTGRRRGKPPIVYAAVDLGTNNCRLLMAKPSAGGFKVVGSFSRIVRLGEGMAESGHLSEAAMNRTLEALKICASKINSVAPARTRAVATEACRSAANRQIFVDRVKAETGLDIETISPKEEAVLTLEGCAPLLDREHPFGLVFDIGGGSVEVMFVETLEPSRPRLIEAMSLPFGVVTLAERHGHDLVAEDDYASMVDVVEGELAGFDERHGISSRIAQDKVQMLGTSGTVTMLGGIYLDLPRYNRSRVDGLDMDFPAIAEINTRLARMNGQERARHPCIGSGRADLVVAGCAILEAVCRRWPAGRLRVADRGIREGLLLGMMTADGDAR